MSMLETRMANERLKNILNILSDYHTQVIQTYSLSSQKPEETIQTIRLTLEKDGDMLEDYIRWRKVPNTNNKALLNCIEALEKELEPWDTQISSLAPTWCRLMFKEYPMTISPEHIVRLYKNAGLEDRDGQVS